MLHLLISYLKMLLVIPILKLIDIIATKIFIYFKKVEPPPSYRWFFVHAVVNWIVTFLAVPDIMFCLNNVSECGTNLWIYGDILSIIATSLHFYHMIYYKLTSTDYLHHITSAIMTTPIILLFNRTSAEIMSLWFVCGLPGAIDYTLLCLVKMGLMDSNLEKKIYVYLSMWIRGPGCIASTVMHIGMAQVWHTFSLIQKICISWNLLVIYWNGIYFAQLTLGDYYKKLYQRLPISNVPI